VAHDLEDDPLLGDREVAAKLRVTVGTLANWRVQGKGPRFLAGRPVLYRASDLAEYIKGRVRQSTSEAAA
jgi:helix-turn-helix protein